ncbi:hypothetical protein [Rhizobium sp. NFACC06-2]|uniref:hypothetical protein n=1 Tax=Rhizobium sp. NFACC06-2 TaxID=1566264 RepID=UPI0008771A19|nr:hypothetical protein [Rhizobium sp. NFACC06-2]SCY80090.1 hypothetical protein SAMN03159288_04338 [Rhizobium sp. NFACC06-2]
MAIYHCSVKPVGRSAGKSAVAAIAYRTASKILNQRDGIIRGGDADCEHPSTPWAGQ